MTTPSAPAAASASTGPIRRAAVLLIAAVLTGAAGCGGRDVTSPPDAVTPAADMARAESLALRAQQAERDGRPDEAVALYRESVTAYREFPAAWTNLGRLLHEAGDGLEAATAYRIAADLSPSDPRPVYNLGLLWQERGYLEEASRLYSQALERDENYLQALRESVYIDRLRGRSDETIARRLRRALLLETDPQWRAYFEREKLRVDEDARALGVPQFGR